MTRLMFGARDGESLSIPVGLALLLIYVALHAFVEVNITTPWLGFTVMLAGSLFTGGAAVLIIAQGRRTPFKRQVIYIIVFFVVSSALRWLIRTTMGA